jgi:hypothetical protein
MTGRNTETVIRQSGISEEETAFRFENKIQFDTLFITVGKRGLRALTNWQAAKRYRGKGAEHEHRKSFG